MYVSGDQRSLRNRIHQFARSSGDFDSFAQEARGYSGDFSFLTKALTTREANSRFHLRYGSTFSADLFASVETSQYLSIIGSPSLGFTDGEEQLIFSEAWTTHSSSDFTTSYDWFAAPTSGGSFQYQTTTSSGFYTIPSGFYRNTLISGSISLTNTEGLSGRFSAGVIDPEFEAPGVFYSFSQQYPPSNQDFPLQFRPNLSGNPTPSVFVDVITGDGVTSGIWQSEIVIANIDNSIPDGTFITVNMTATSSPFSAIGVTGFYTYTPAWVGSAPTVNTDDVPILVLTSGSVLAYNEVDLTYGYNNFAGWFHNSGTLSFEWRVGNDPTGGTANTLVSHNPNYVPSVDQIGQYLSCDLTMTTPWGFAVAPSTVSQIVYVPFFAGSLIITDHVFNGGSIHLVDAPDLGLTCIPGSVAITFTWYGHQRGLSTWSALQGQDVFVDQFGRLPSEIIPIDPIDGSLYDYVKCVISTSNAVGSGYLESNLCAVDLAHY